MQIQVVSSILPQGELKLHARLGAKNCQTEDYENYLVSSCMDHSQMDKKLTRECSDMFVSWAGPFLIEVYVLIQTSSIAFKIEILTPF